MSREFQKLAEGAAQHLREGGRCSGMKRLPLVSVGAILATFLAVAPAMAKTFEVTRRSDPAPGQCKPNDCSLREAIRAANARSGKDVVVLPARGRYTLKRANITPGVDEDKSLRGDLDVAGKLTLSHPGRGKATIDADGVDRVVEVRAPTVVKRIKLTGGDHPANDGSGIDGSGILTHASLTLSRSSVVGNKGAKHGGGIESYPLVNGETLSLRLNRSKVVRNNADGLGGGIDANRTNVRLSRSKVTANEAGNAGAGVTMAGGDLRMNRTTVAGNRAGAGSAGVYLFEADGVIANSTVSGNVAPLSGSSGGGIDANGSLTITNSTVAGNSATNDAGGIRITGLDGALTLRSATVVRNVADSDGLGGGAGGGVLQEGGASATVVNSIIALNRTSGPTPADDCSGAFTSQGGNLLTSTAGCIGFSGSDDFLTSNPKLGQLKRNGGPTKTVALKRGSPAIGKAAEPAAPKRDQRGVKRDNRPDIGAYER